MEQYHGTNMNTAIAISSGKVNVMAGGGELGQGFYTGDLAHEAFNWAWIKYKTHRAVVKFNIDDDDLLNLQPLCLNYRQTMNFRYKIRNLSQTRVYRFHRNIIWAPVVGKEVSNFNQFKYESFSSEIFINGEGVIKKIL